MITKTTVTTTATQISTARLRQWAIIENQGSVDMYVAYDGSTPTGPSGASPGTLVAAGTKESVIGPFGGVITAIVASATTVAVVQEV